MTFLTTPLKLTRDLSAQDFENFRRFSTVYGIRGLSVKNQNLIVEYDASRIHEAEVVAQARAFGIPAEPPTPIAPGAFDYTGEFKDFAWPVTGVTPVNAK